MGRELSNFGKTNTTSSLGAPTSYRRTETRTIERILLPNGQIAERIQERIVTGDAPPPRLKPGRSDSEGGGWGCLLVLAVLAYFWYVGTYVVLG